VVDCLQLAGACDEWNVLAQGTSFLHTSSQLAGQGETSSTDYSATSLV
jgi:hypothetical protein